MRNTQLYAYYKQATQDPPIDKAENPGTFDFKVCLDSHCPEPGALDSHCWHTTGQSQEARLAEGC